LVLEVRAQGLQEFPPNVKPKSLSFRFSLLEQLARRLGKLPPLPAREKGAGGVRSLAHTLPQTALTLAVALRSTVASAETSTPLDRFHPAPAGDAFLGVPSASVGDLLRPSFAILGAYAASPLRQRISPPGGPEQTRILVSHQLFAHALGSVEFARRFKLEAALPVVLSQGGSGTSDAGISLAAPGAAGLGDLRLGGRVEVAEQRHLFPSVALALSVWAPTSSAGPYSGAPGFRAAPALIVGAELPYLVWSASLARRFQESSPESLQRSEVAAAAAAAARLGPLQIGPELWITQAADGFGLSARTRDFGGELLLTGRYRTGPLLFSLGAGPGLGGAPGVPAYRVVAGVSFAPELIFRDPPPPLPGQPSPQEGVTTDTIPGTNTPGVATGSGGTGLPPVDPPPVAPAQADQDGDGVPDEQDRCPAVAGVPSLDPAKNGCPADQDGDGIPDKEDACPQEKGEASREPTEHGCPKAVRVQGEQIVILQQVNFKTASDVIDPGSFGLLQQVMEVIQQHPEIARVAIDGHTDDQGNAQANVELSRRRAVSVLRWMSERGVDARRLEARGFGPKRPVADNKTEAGRAKNRRVEFQILRRTPRGEAGWQEGSVGP
jgi:outer membrane protein OmpA-like peptidoglycan-associated protein